MEIPILFWWMLAAAIGGHFAAYLVGWFWRAGLAAFFLWRINHGPEVKCPCGYKDKNSRRMLGHIAGMHPDFRPDRITEIMLKYRVKAPAPPSRGVVVPINPAFKQTINPATGRPVSED